MKAIRSIDNKNSEHQNLYLTFDDGPDPVSTEKVLKVLEQHHAKATFFVVAERAKAQKKLLNEILSCGHAIGNHSLDHQYRVFFQGKKAMQKWVRDAESQIADLIGSPTIGFRPPAGVRTPELHAVLLELKLPLVLWKMRYFDKAIDWTEKRALNSLSRITQGSLILLHDQVKREKIQLFTHTLSIYLDELNQRNFHFHSLSLALCKQQYPNQMKTDKAE